MVKKPEKPKSFRDPVEPETQAERLLADCVLRGEFADVSDFAAEEAKEVRAAFLRGLCLNAEQCAIDPRGIWLRGAKITGTLDLDGVALDRTLWFSNCSFTNRPILRDTKGKTLGFVDCTLPGFSADRLFLEGSLSFRGTKVTDEARFPGAKVTAQIDCSEAVFTNRGGKAFFADGLEVVDGLIFRAAKVTGEMRLLGAKVGGQVDFFGADLANEDGIAFYADRLEVRESLAFQTARIAGQTRLLGAKIGGHIYCFQATFTNDGGEAFIADGLELQGALFFAGLMAPIIGTMSLNHALVDTLIADDSGWPARGSLDIDGFRYRSLGVYHPWTTLLGWIERQAPGAFASQPYEQAIKVYLEAGHLADAREMGIAKEEAISSTGNWSLAGRAWRRFFGLTISYGYKPWRALIILYFISVGVFAFAFDSGYMLPSKERVFLHSCFVDESPYVSCPGWERPSRWWTLSAPIRLPAKYPAFNPLAYSLDTLIPLFDLHQENYWLPSGGGATGGFLKFWLWFQIVSGWILTTLTVGSLTGIIKKIE